MHISDISVVVPLYNEEESLRELHAWIVKVCESHQLTFEVIMIDDGSKDGSWQVVSSIAETDTRIKGIRFQRNYGKSAALHVG